MAQVELRHAGPPLDAVISCAPARQSGEVDRLRALASFAVLDTPAEKVFDDLAALAAHVCATPIALISLVDAERHWFKARHGLDLTEVARRHFFCTHALYSTDTMTVADARVDPRFAAIPLVVDRPQLRFYAGAPLRTADGHVLGTLCVLDTKTRVLDEPARRFLTVLADQVISQLEMRRQGAALRQQQRMLAAVLEHTDVLIYAKDVDGRFVMSNAALQRVTQVTGGLIGRTDHELFPIDIADEYRRHDTHIMTTRERQVFTEDLIHPDGSTHTYRSTKFPLINDAGEVIGIGGVSTDVTELDAARAAHEAAEQRWRALIEQSPVAMAVVSADGQVAYANPQAIAMCGMDAGTRVQSRCAFDFLPAGVRGTGRQLLGGLLAGGAPLRAHQSLLQRADGTRVTAEINATLITYHGVPAVLLEMRDVTAAAAARAALERFASTDPLTGLLNRRGWDTSLSALLPHVRQDAAPWVIALFDFDHFKAYNDAYGHPQGDELLRNFAGTARAALRAHDLFARWGGEEFILALPETPPQETLSLLNRIRACIPAGQTCSVGYTTWLPPESLTQAVNRADAALYQAKTLGRDRIEHA
ncbi:diguanylate cyclase domain-containing protein [Mycobacterium asiaticum]|uniref:sensor domain-containing diguanylate cyclase n=1 Tax=Mycobacterium asiaticum TaxID=1790 RepID=UPI0009C0CDE9|nr:diguanylate cyclase [Mycobacterium asiaticum]